MMKRAVFVILTAVLLLAYCVSFADPDQQEFAVGSSVYFGSYEQDNDTEDGAEPIEWLVLAVDNDKALLLSRYALDCQPYNM